MRDLWASILTDSRHAGLHASIWWLLRHGIYPLLPNSIRRNLRAILKIDRHARRRATWLAPGMKKLLKERREALQPRSPEKARRVGQREMAMTISSAYNAHALELEERLASSVGIELRRPFYDANFIQFCFDAPLRLHMRGSVDKYLHRRALANHLPREVINRRTKAEFCGTFLSYTTEVRRYMERELSEEARGWIDCRELERALGKYGEEDRNSSWTEWRVWALMGCDAVASSLIGKHPVSLPTRAAEMAISQGRADVCTRSRRRPS
jgi:asparagine synthase (glutamine-hydrolysing)